MIYYHTDRFKEHWKDIEEMVDENYSSGYEDDTCLILSANLILDLYYGNETIPKHNKKIVYQTEPLIEEHWWNFDDMINSLRNYDEVWEYDLDNIETLKKYGIDAKFKPFSYSESLKRVKNKEEPDIDILFYGTKTEHRNKVLNDLVCYYLPYNLNIVSLNNVTGALLDDFISRSKIILDLSSNGLNSKRIQKQSRIYYPIINNKCVISEKSEINYFGDLITEFEIDENLKELTDIIKDYLYNEKWKKYSNVSDEFKFKMKEKDNDKTIVQILNDYDINKDEYPGGTDKCSSHSYDLIYEELLSPFRRKKGNLLEIGIYRGGSILLWSEYLKNFKIFGVDCQDYVNYSNNVVDYVEKNSEKISLKFADAYTSETVNYFNSICPDGFDIIIDDGPHTEESQVNCIELYLDLLKDNGILIIEDIQDFSSIEVLKQSIPKSLSFDYEVSVYDNREVKQRYDDVLFVIKKTIKKTEDEKSKIGVFYHVYQINDWKKLYQEQVNSLIVSGIYDACDFIHIGINGDQELPFVLDKMKVQYNENKILEANTLHALWDFSQKNPDYNILYFHTKGLTHTSEDDFSINTNSWRIYLEYYVFHQWKTCIKDLSHYDCVGAEWVEKSQLFDSNLQQNVIHINPHYAGNFWWAKTNYIKKLDLCFIYNEENGWGRYRSEFWIGTKNPKFKSYHNSNVNLYEVLYNPNKYHIFSDNIEKVKVKENEILHRMKTSDKKTKIVMISMFKNESKGILRMLESCYNYIDYWILQDNGSTDGTPEIVREFFADKNIPGFIYKVEEGWVGFGWNRDHLLQTCLQTDHGCDWIMKMDCDEYLEVDEDFDWSPFYNKDIESFHVTAQSLGCIYYRAWIWNAKLPWKFKHDVAHECIYLDNEKGENFERVNLHRGLRMIGTNDGESYTVPTKYISDALKLEEQMIREGTMLTDLYHFWYIAKSYMDCYNSNFYPLGEQHSKEFAKRFIFYFEEYLNYVNPQGVHEMSYFAAFSIGLGYRYLKDYEKAIWWFNNAEQYCPMRNEHIVYLAETYNELKQYQKMFNQSERLLDQNRKLPFPDYYFLLDTNYYYDSGTVPQQLYQYSLSKILENQNTDINSFSVNVKTKPRLWIVDDFYEDPHAVRKFALEQDFEENINYYKGNRTKEQFIVPGTKEAFEKIIGKRITRWTETHGMCGRFQYCTAEDDLVYHCDSQTFAGMIYLTPDAPFSCGTSLFAHKRSKLRNENDFEEVDIFSETGYYDRSKFELVDTAGNVFNRLVLFDAKCIHSANEYFGTDITNSRLFHLFFFDCDEI